VPVPDGGSGSGFVGEVSAGALVSAASGVPECHQWCLVSALVSAGLKLEPVVPALGKVPGSAGGFVSVAEPV
jgi:hypothetical protein